MVGFPSNLKKTERKDTEGFEGVFEELRPSERASVAGSLEMNKGLLRGKVMEVGGENELACDTWARGQKSQCCSVMS